MSDSSHHHHHLTLEQKIFLVRHVHGENHYTDAVKEKFASLFPDCSVPRRNTVHELVRKFEHSGSVLNIPSSGRPSVITEEKVVKISDIVSHAKELNKVDSDITHSTSIRKIASQVDLSVGTTHKVMREYLHLYPYKYVTVQELKESDPVERLLYCKWLKATIDKGPQFFDNVIFSDEAYYHVGGMINSQNMRIWSQENPHEIKETKPLYPAKIGVWLGFSRSHILEPIFFTETITGKRYINQILTPFLAQLSQGELERGYFQQDSAPAHTAGPTLKFLDNFFGDRIISKGLWPARSPDLNPLDYFFWASSKNEIYKREPQTIDELKSAIEAYAKSITKETLIKVFDSMVRRVKLCIEHNGGHFQHFL